MAFSV